MMEKMERMERKEVSCKEGFLQGLVSLMMFVAIILIPAFAIRGMVRISQAPVPTVPDYILMVPELIPITVVAGFTAAAICDSFGESSRLKSVFMIIMAFCLVLLIAEGFALVYLVGNGIKL